MNKWIQIDIQIIQPDIQKQTKNKLFDIYMNDSKYLFI